MYDGYTSLLTQLQRPESTTTKEITILTLTRIFLLTHGQPTLLREITTPSLAPFVTSCLSLVTWKDPENESKATDVHSPLLNIVLLSFSRLVPNHPASLRPFSGRLRSLIAPLLAPTPSTLLNAERQPESRFLPASSTVGLGQRLHALLPTCAAKGGSSDEWSKYVVLILQNINRIENLVFRGVIRHQTSSSNRAASAEDTVADDAVDDLQLPPWQGIHAGCERLVGLVQLLQAYLATKTTATISIPLGAIFAVLEQILSVFAPDYSQSRGAEMQLNPAVSREERDALYSMLPSIHTAAVECFSLLMARASYNAMSFASVALDQISWLFQRTRTTSSSRIAMYNLLSQIIGVIGASASVENVTHMSRIIRKASHDLIPPNEGIKQPSVPRDSQTSKVAKSNPDSYLNNSKAKSPSNRRPPKQLQEAALRLLTLSTATLPAEKFSVSLRHEMDRVAVLLQDERLMQASVLNPARSQGGAPLPTLLPFLSRAHPASLGTEALLRPRMPSIRNRRGEIENEFSEDEMSVGLPSDRFEEPDTMARTSMSIDPATLSASGRSMVDASMSGAIADSVLPPESPKRPLETQTPFYQNSLFDTIGEPVQKRPRLESEELTELVASSDDIVQKQVEPDTFIPAFDRTPPPPVIGVPEEAENEEDDSDLDSNGSINIPPIIVGSDFEDDDSEEGDGDVDMTSAL